MGYCPADCADITLVGNPTGGCELSDRKRTPSRIAFWSCKLALPNPFTAENTAPLFTAKDIVLSSPLANFTINDPETERKIIHDCIPEKEYVTRRTITFEDRIAINIAATEDEPTEQKYFDYSFWKNKQQYRLLLRYGIVYCNGDFEIMKDESGNPMEAWFDIFRAFDALGNNGGRLEIKKGKLEFAGDPLKWEAPEFNLVDFGINV